MAYLLSLTFRHNCRRVEPWAWPFGYIRS